MILLSIFALALKGGWRVVENGFILSTNEFAVFFIFSIPILQQMLSILAIHLFAVFGVTVNQVQAQQFDSRKGVGF